MKERIARHLGEFRAQEAVGRTRTLTKVGQGSASRTGGPGYVPQDRKYWVYE